MKILVFAHRLEVGGTQVNAIELAAALRDLHGHEVVLFATPGPMAALAKKKGLRLIPAPDAYIHPSPARMAALRDVVRRERPDVLHVWDWWQCLDAYYSVYLPMRVPMVVSDMMMELTRILPKWLPTTFGVPELVDKARAQGRSNAQLILPPVDVHHNAPGVVDSQSFCAAHGLSERCIKIVSVSRLSEWMKSESLVRSIEAVRSVGKDLPLQLAIVGDGGARARLETLATRCNAELGRAAVVFTGALLDPRPAYAAADIVIGMGGSALRGMAFAKPVIVVGEEGFAAPFSPQTSDEFYYRGLYGRGDGAADAIRLAGIIRELASQPDQLPVLGEYARHYAVRHYSLETVAGQLSEICARAVAELPAFGVAAADGLRSAAVYLRERRFLSPSRDRVVNDRVADASA